MSTLLALSQETDPLVKPLLSNLTGFYQSTSQATIITSTAISWLKAFEKTYSQADINMINVLEIWSCEADSIQKEGRKAGRKHHIRSLSERIVTFFSSTYPELDP